MSEEGSAWLDLQLCGHYSLGTMSSEFFRKVALFIVLFMLLYNLSKSKPLYSAIYRKVFFGCFSSPKNPNTRRIDYRLD